MNDNPDIIQLQAYIVKLFKHVCTRCGYTWIPKTIRPAMCPRCHSPYWNKKRTKISGLLHAELEKLKTDAEVQLLLKKMGIKHSEFLTKEKVERRRNALRRWTKYIKKKKEGEALTSEKEHEKPH